MTTMLLDFPHGYTGILVALVSGWFGAGFFMLVQLQARLSEGGMVEAREMWTWYLLLLRSLMGIGGAAILYFFFETGLLEGAIWPDLQQLHFSQVVRVVEKNEEPIGSHLVPNINLSLLVVWSFLAGYSQTFVPNILERTEARANKSDT